MPRVRVSAERIYDVIIGSQWRLDIAELSKGRTRVAIISSKEIHNLVMPLPTFDAEILHIEIPDGEEGKTPESLLQIIHKLGEAGFTRSDLIVAIGGGATTDIAGFAAATWLRGIDWVSIPTTIAGAVDAAIGGKTGANTEHGKNLFGAFHSPIAVLIDLAWFTTMSDRDFAAGLAEVVKCGFIKDPSILELIEGKTLSELRTNPVALEYLILKSVQVKASVVGKDFKESGEREILNYGHTLGHAIEKRSKYQLRHGECVAIGMVFAAELAARRGLITDDLVRRHRDILSNLNLPVTYDASAWSDLEPLLLLDKKARGKVTRFVLLDGIGRTTRAEGLSSDDLREVYEKVSS